MNIVVGRGKRRAIYTVPMGSTLLRYNQQEQDNLIADVRQFLRVPLT